MNVRVSTRSYLRAALTIVFLLILSATISVRSALAQQVSGSTVHGAVVSATGAPIVHASVRLVSAAAGHTAKIGSSGTDGAFTFTGVSAGTYFLEVTDAGYNPATSTPFPVHDESVAVNVTLAVLNVTSLNEIGRVRVDGTDQLNSSGVSSVTITAEDLRTNGITNIADALDNIPGVTIQRSDGESSAMTALDIRGTTGVDQYGGVASAENLVLLDGEPQRTGFYGNMDLSSFFPDIFARIEVQKGVGGTTIYGADTVGGTVNFVTRQPAATHETDLYAGGGDRGQYIYSILDTNTIGRLGYVFAYGRYGTDGIFPLGNKVDTGGPGLGWFFGGQPTTYTPQTAIGSINTLSDATMKTALFSKLRYQLSPATYATFSYYDYNDTRYNDDSLTIATPLTIGGSTYANDPLGIPYVEAYPGNLGNNSTPKIALDISTQALGGTLILRGYNQFVKIDYNYLNDPDPYEQFYEYDESHLSGEQIQFVRPLDPEGRQTLTFGYGADSNNFVDLAGSSLTTLVNQASFAEIKRTTFLRDDIIFGPRLSANLALFQSDYDTLNIRRLDPHLAVAYRPDQNSVVHFSVASGFVPQRLTDLAGITEGDLDYPQPSSLCPATQPTCLVYGGNPNLKPETAFGYDLGYDRKFANGSSFSASVYHNDEFNHFFFSIFPAPGGYVFANGEPALFEDGPINVGRSIFQGIELSGEQALPAHLFVKGYYTVQSAYPIGVDLATIEISPDLVNKQQFDDIPLHKIGGSLNLRIPNGMQAYVGFTFYDVNNPYNVAPFSLFDAGVTLPIGKNRLHITASNLFNKDATLYDTLNGVPYSGYNGPYLFYASSTAPHSFLVTLERKIGR